MMLKKNKMMIMAMTITTTKTTTNDHSSNYRHGKCFDFDGSNDNGYDD